MITVPTNGCTVGISQMLTGTNRKTISVTTDIEATIFEVESKLTEADFTSRPQDVVTRYRDFDWVFDLPMLPQTETDYRGYQLVRNILCAAAHGYVFTLVSDARRPDLIRDWRSVGRAVRDAALRARLRLVLWQEVAAEAPEPTHEAEIVRSALGPRCGVSGELTIVPLGPISRIRMPRGVSQF